MTEKNTPNYNGDEKRPCRVKTARVSILTYCFIRAVAVDYEGRIPLGTEYDSPGRPLVVFQRKTLLVFYPGKLGPKSVQASSYGSGDRNATEEVTTSRLTSQHLTTKNLSI